MSRGQGRAAVTLSGSPDTELMVGGDYSWLSYTLGLSNPPLTSASRPTNGFPERRYHHTAQMAEGLHGRCLISIVFRCHLFRIIIPHNEPGGSAEKKIKYRNRKVTSYDSAPFMRASELKRRERPPLPEAPRRKSTQCDKEPRDGQKCTWRPPVPLRTAACKRSKCSVTIAPALEQSRVSVSLMGHSPATARSIRAMERIREVEREKKNTYDKCIPFLKEKFRETFGEREFTVRGLWFGSRGTIPKRTRSFLEELGVDIKE
ncbi:unnamed protein product [Nezara viridula]|uniref:Uncharacterized protein n=1 Tax=Nezara viridula TaxID=85310 RepID=A0A9P0HL62_NEZVI|nr:unnamed protein product [Nezara viridula]